MDDQTDKKAESSEEEKAKQETPSPEGEKFEFSLKKSRPELFGAYPFSYIELYTRPIIVNFIEKQINVGANIGGVVGDHGQVDIDSMQVDTQSNSSGANKKEDYPQPRAQRNKKKVKKDKPTPKSSQLLRFNNEDDVDKWFFSQNSVDNQLHLITVGVFAGNTNRFITETREKIKSLLGNFTKNNEAELSLTAFTKGDSTILEKTGTKIIESEFSVESGKTQLKTVTFIDPECQKYVLRFTSSAVDIAKIRAVVERLLAQICQLDGIDIHTMGTPLIDLTRAQSAIGLGELAKSDYEYYLNNIIRPWAKSPDPFLRFLVGWILFALATEETHKPKVVSLLTHWSKSKNLFLEWTSAAACSRFGLIDFDKTLEIAKNLFESDYKYTLYATRVSLSLLYFSGQNACKIINALADWSENPDIDPNKRYFIRDNLATAFLYLVTDQIKNDIDDLESSDDKKESEKEKINRLFGI